MAKNKSNASDASQGAATSTRQMNEQELESKSSPDVRGASHGSNYNPHDVADRIPPGQTPSAEQLRENAKELEQLERDGNKA